MGYKHNPAKYWNTCYETGKDFRFISADALTKTVSYHTDDAPRTCLDIGCGTGQLTRELAHRGFECVGIDIARRAIKMARSLTVHDKLQYYQFDIEQMT